METDLLKVYMKDNTRYGTLADDDATRAIRYLDDNDETEPRGPSIFTDGFYKDRVIVVEKLASLLIQIPMRNCWMDELEDMIKSNPVNLALMAIGLGHLDLSKRLVDEMNLVNLNNFVYMELLLLSFNSGSIDMLRYVYSKRKMSPNDEMRGFIKFVSPITTRHLPLFQYIDQPPDLFKDLIEHIVFGEGVWRTDVAVWEALMDLKSWNCTRFPPKLSDCDLKSAQKIVNRLGPNSIGSKILTYAAARSDFETFNFLWENKRLDLTYEGLFLSAGQSSIPIMELDSKMAMHMIMHVDPFRRFILPKAAKVHFEYSPPLYSFVDKLLIRASDVGNFELVKFLCEYIKKFEDQDFAKSYVEAMN
ncbi:hypothetical protein HDU76_011232, partial [Blyttiomyces sp. JEL0837]